MFKIISKTVPVLICWGIFTYVILQVPYPESISQASLFQLIAFFMPLFLAISFSFNLFLKNIFVSSSISLGIIFLLILKALGSLNLVTGVLTIISISLLVSYFRKSKNKQSFSTSKSLTSEVRIPTLTKLRKEKS